MDPATVTQDQLRLQDAAHLLDVPTLTTHLHQRLAAKPIEMDPMPHVVVDEILPPATYQLLLDAIPSVEHFSTRERVKQNWEVTDEYTGSDFSKRVWSAVDADWMGRCVLPEVINAFRDQLFEHYRALFGEALAPQAISQQTARRGRVMLRRPGYHLKPHRDPLTAAMTVLLYLARPGDDSAFGTQLYRVKEDRVPDRSKTYYPPPELCEQVVDVPFRPNTALLFINSTGGAHGAGIPKAAPPELERYSYQAYIGPRLEHLAEVLNQLTGDARARWAPKLFERRS
jgi:hypothetical protein